MRQRRADPCQKLVVCLLIVGFALKLGLIPFYFWLPAVASAAAPMTTALIVSVVDIATFGELAALREVSPWVFGEHAPVWMVVALLSMFGGALLALAQTELKRMLAFSTINDMGFLLLGLIIGGPVRHCGRLPRRAQSRSVKGHSLWRGGVRGEANRADRHP